MDKRTTRQRNLSPPSGAPESGAPTAGRRWGRFLASLLGVLVFAFGVIPGLQRLGPVREVRDAIRNTAIDATALFYTESDVCCEAEASIRNAIRYSAHPADRPAAPSRDAIEKSHTVAKRDGT